MTRRINIEEIEDGMVTAMTLTNKFGQIVMPAGTEINRKQIKMFRTWNITHVEVMTEDDDEITELTEEILKMAADYLEQKMDWKPRNPIEEDLLHIGIINRGRKILMNQRNM